MSKSKPSVESEVILHFDFVLQKCQSCHHFCNLILIVLIHKVTSTLIGLIFDFVKT